MLMEVAEMPHRPSDLLSMPADGYSPVACLDFDLGCVGFARRFRRMQEATVLVDAPKTGKHRRAQVSAPKHSESELLRVLGIDLEDRGALAVDRHLEQLTLDGAAEQLPGRDGVQLHAEAVLAIGRRQEHARLLDQELVGLAERATTAPVCRAAIPGEATDQAATRNRERIACARQKIIRNAAKLVHARQWR